MEKYSGFNFGNKKAFEAVRGKKISDANVIWKGQEFELDKSWLFEGKDKEISHFVDLARRLAPKLINNPNNILTMEPQMFDLGPFRDRLRNIMSCVRNGPGVALYRGLPTQDLSLLEIALIYWGIGKHIGIAQSNNSEGDMIGHVVDAGRNLNDPNHRGYQTNATMDYHCDQTDIVCLLCINTAKSGGLSKLSSSILIYNELLKRRPDLVELMCQPFYWTKHSEKNSGEAPYYKSPIFNFIDNTLSIAFGPKHIEKGHALEGVPEMRPKQVEGISLMESIAEDFHAKMELKQGDIQFVNNYTVVHTRTAFDDWPDSDRKRTLWRLWLNLKNFHPRTPYSNQWHQGVRVNGIDQRIQLNYSQVSKNWD